MADRTVKVLTMADMNDVRSLAEKLAALDLTAAEAEVLDVVLAAAEAGPEPDRGGSRG